MAHLGPGYNFAIDFLFPEGQHGYGLLAIPFIAMACIVVVCTVMVDMAMGYLVMAGISMAYVPMTVEIGPVWSWHV